jgi:hypothetical protein
MSLSFLVVFSCLIVETLTQSFALRPNITKCIARGVDCPCQLSLLNECSDPPSNRSADICYLSCCCEMGLCCSLSNDLSGSNHFVSEPIAVAAFLPTEGTSMTRASWSISSVQQALCNFQWSTEDAQVIFNRYPTIFRSRSLIPAAWTPPSIPLSESTQIVGFQLSVYAIPDFNSPSCTIESFRIGINDTDAVDFLWRQVVVTDNPSLMRRYTYRSNATRLGDARLTWESLSKPPYFSIIMTRGGGNGSCWIDCIELQLLYTQSILTLPPGETARPTPPLPVSTQSQAQPNQSQSTVLVSTSTSPSEFPTALVAGLAGALAFVVLTVVIAGAVMLWRRSKKSKAQHNPSAVVPAGNQPQQQQYRSLAGVSQEPSSPYDTGNVNPSNYEMLHLTAANDRTHYVPGTEFTN